MKVLRVRLRGITVLGILAALTVVFIYLPPVFNHTQLIADDLTVPENPPPKPLLQVQESERKEELTFPLLSGDEEPQKRQDSPTQKAYEAHDPEPPAPDAPDAPDAPLEKLIQKEEPGDEHPLLNENEHDSYMQDYPDYTPANFVEVKKIKPKTITEVEVNASKRRARLKLPFPSSLEAAKPEFSPEALRNRALSFSNSSSLRQFLTEQDRRSQHVSKACREVAHPNVDTQDRGMGPPPGLAGIHNLLLDRMNQIAYCPIYKAASTSWTITLLEIGGYWPSKKRKNERLQNLVSQVFPKVSNYAGPTLSRQMTRFMVVRHPFERMLSCYRDKFEHAKKVYYYIRYGEKMIRNYRQFPDHLTSPQLGMLQEQVRAKVKAGLPVVLPGNPFTNPLGPTFPEFVQYILHAKHDDEHWRTYYGHCTPCHMDYHFVLRFENMHEEGKLFLEYLNRTSQVHMRWENPTQGGSTTSDVICSYYNQLSLETIKELSLKYDRDFKLYEYKPDKYFKCATDYVEEKDEVESI